MAKFTLSFHEIKLSVARKTVGLSTTIGKSSVFDFFVDFFEHKLPRYNPTARTQEITARQRTSLEAGTTVFVERTEKDTAASSICGVLRSGAQGISSDLIDVKTTAAKYKRKTTDLELMPFYFRLEIPHNGNTGYFVLQGIGQNKIFTPVQSAIKREFDSFKQANGTLNAVLKIAPIFIGKLFVDQYLENGVVKKVSATKYEKRADFFSKQGEDCKVTTTIEGTSKNPFSRKVNDIVRRTATSKEIKIHLNSLFSMSQDELSEMKVYVEYNGELKSIDVDDFKKSATNYDVSEVEKDLEGNPVFDKINQEAIRILNSHIKPLVC